MATRSTLLAAGRVGTGTERVLLTVPAGITVLLKSVYGYAYGAGSGRLNVVVALPPAAGFAATSIVTAGDESWRWDGWLALDPGWRLSLYNAHPAGVDFAASGTVLPGVAQELPSARPT